MGADADRLEAMLTAQRNAQEQVFGYEIDRMTNEQRIEYIKDMVLALTDELHEALNETGWKSWSTGDHIYTDLYIGELVDAFALLMNLLMATGLSPDEVANELFRRYSIKNSVNLQRQTDGYRV